MWKGARRAQDQQETGMGRASMADNDIELVSTRKQRTRSMDISQDSGRSSWSRESRDGSTGAHGYLGNRMLVSIMILTTDKSPTLSKRSFSLLFKMHRFDADLVDHLERVTIFGNPMRMKSCLLYTSPSPRD